MNAIQEYSQTDAALAVLGGKYAGVTYAVETTAGMRDAVAARAEVRGYRVALEKRRVEIKAPALERCRLIDTARNMRAAKAIVDRGLDMGLASARVGGRGVAEWTAQDLDVLRAWIGPASSSASAPGLSDMRRQADAEIVRYTTLGVTLVALEAFYGRQCGEWGPDELADLRAKYPRIKKGENAADVFPPREINAPDAAPEPGSEG